MGWPVAIVLIGVGIVAALVSGGVAWRYLATGHADDQLHPNGEPVTRDGTPIVFWLHVAMHAVYVAAFLWMAVHVLGYKLGWWEWAI